MNFVFDNIPNIKALVCVLFLGCHNNHTFLHNFGLVLHEHETLPPNYFRENDFKSFHFKEILSNILAFLDLAVVQVWITYLTFEQDHLRMIPVKFGESILNSWGRGECFLRWWTYNWYHDVIWGTKQDHETNSLPRVWVWWAKQHK